MYNSIVLIKPDLIETASEEGFFTFKEEYRGYLVKKRIERVLRELEESSLLDEKEKFLEGRIAYGGVWNPDNIDNQREMTDEVIDFANYSDSEEYLQYLFDPVSFDEFVSQYMQ